MKTSLARARTVQHYRPMPFTSAQLSTTNAAARGRASAIVNNLRVNNNSNNASLPQAGD